MRIAQINKKILVLIISSFLAHNIYSKGATFILGTSLNSTLPWSLMLNHPEIKNRPLIGAGAYINVYTEIKKSKVSSIVYGAEISSMRLLFDNSSLKLPLYYSFNSSTNNSVNFRINLGSNILIQPHSFTTSTNIRKKSIQFERVLVSGIFPLLHLDFGIEFQTKNKEKFLFSLGFNKGFSENEKLTFSKHNYESIRYLNNAYIELRLGCKINSLLEIIRRKLK